MIVAERLYEHIKQETFETRSSFTSVGFALLLVLIATIVLICKSLWIKVSAKLINVNVILILLHNIVHKTE